LHGAIVAAAQYGNEESGNCGPQPAWRQTLHAFDGLLAAILFDVVFGSRARPSILLLPVLPGESTLK
jgi:hypothetical protein